MIPQERYKGKKVMLDLSQKKKQIKNHLKEKIGMIMSIHCIAVNHQVNTLPV
jgi:hypothetical protein